MNGHGENLAVDGDPGPKTQCALAKFDVQLVLSKAPVALTPEIDEQERTSIFATSNEVEKPEVPAQEDYLKPAVEMIKEFEGIYLNAYLDPVGIPTIGWGTIRYPNGAKVQMGDQITQAQAEEYLRHEMMGFVASVKSLVKVPISNNAFCALVSFCYNLGAGALGGSTLLRRLNSGQPIASVASEFDKWVNAGGKVLAGLVRRRKAEKELFLA
jgi:GH24 family phage-related lysozyme (muramidase)